MPVVLVHGVNTRDDVLPARFTLFLNRYLAPVMRVEKIEPHYVFWGDLGARFRFGGRSRPRTRFRKQGGGTAGRPEELIPTELVQLTDVLHAVPDAPVERSPVTPTGYAVPGSRAAAPGVRLRDLPAEAMRDFLMATVEEAFPRDANTRPPLMIAIDDLVGDGSLHAALRDRAEEDEIEVLLEQVRLRMEQPGYVAQGGGLARFGDRVRESLSRGAGAPAYALSAAFAELRPRTDTFLEQFVGDVLVYLDERTSNGGVLHDAATGAALDAIDARLAPALAATDAGPIQQRLVRDLIVAHGARTVGEPLVLITHSMGGQLAYDALTSFLPRLRTHLTSAGVAAEGLARVLPFVDFWAATASQVGLFEELGLFLASDRDGEGRLVPFPGEFLGAWWNVWDHNDVLSYSVSGIIDKVDDGPVDSGRSLLGAHGAYLERPSFYRKLAGKLGEQLQRTR